MTASARIGMVVPGTRPENAEVEQSILAERGRISPLYQALLNSVPLAAGWESLLSAIRNRSSVAPDLRELLILRVAVLNRAPFEFDAHVPHARKAGVSEAKLKAIQEPELGDAFGTVERDVLVFCDAMTRDVQVSDELFEPILRNFDERARVELIATVAAYNMVSRFLEALHIGH
jgi:4-carboxymuconolactone decarboxylase